MRIPSYELDRRSFIAATAGCLCGIVGGNRQIENCDEIMNTPESVIARRNVSNTTTIARNAIFAFFGAGAMLELKDMIDADKDCRIV